LSASTRATIAAAATGVAHEVVEFGEVHSLHEAAQVQGLSPGQLLKTMVVRLQDGTYRLVLVPGDRRIAWKKFRAHAGVKRTSMPSADEAFAVTGYRPGTITPFGADGNLVVVIDESVREHDRITVGGGGNGISIHLTPNALIEATAAEVADVTDLA
jgi:Cys-tRNA(Pro)/Cys-tRNA(Cys) deacylase